MSDPESEDWRPEHFAQRVYAAQGPALNEQSSIRLLVQVDGQTVANFEAREPGMLAFVSRPDDNGFAIVMIEPTGQRLTDYPNTLGQYTTPPPPDWALEALGLERSDGHRSPDNAV